MRLRQLLSILLVTIPLWMLAQTYGSLTMENGLMDNTVTAFCQDDHGMMFLGNYRGVDRFDGSHVVNIPFEPNNDEESNCITAIVEEDKEHLLVGNADGLWRLDKRRLTLTRIFQKTIDCGVTALQVKRTKGRKGSKIIISTQLGVYEMDKGTDNSSSEGSLRKISNRHCSTPVRQNVTPKGWGRLRKADFYFKSSLNGNQWVSYNFFGVDYSYLNRGIFHVIDAPGIFDSRNIPLRNYLVDNNRIFLCTREGLYVYDRSASTFHPVCQTLLGNSIITQMMSLGNKYLVATIGQGVLILNKVSLAVEGHVLNGANVYQLCQDKHGNVWMCSSAGLASYNPQTGHMVVFQTRNSQLPSDEVLCIGFDSDGIGWVSTSNGLCQYLPALHVLAANALPKRIKQVGTLRTISALPKGRLLLIPQHGKPFIYQEASDRLKTIPLQMDSTAKLLYLHIANDSTFVFVTSNGIYSQQGNRLRRFGYIDGLSNQEFQSHSVVLDRKGLLWAATNGGLVYAKLQDLLQQRPLQHYDIFLTQIQTDHWFSPAEATAVMMDHTLQLSRYRSEFTVQFAPHIYGNTNDIRYRYRLEGAKDDSWKGADHNHIISYRHLAAGDYKLVIEAVGMPEISTTVNVIVPYTYRSIAICLAIFVLTLIIGYPLYCNYTKTPYFWKQWEPKPERYQNSKVSPQRAAQLQKQLLAAMEKQKPYLNANLQMGDLAKMLGCSAHELSQVFSQYMQRSYYDFVAEYRINEFKRLAVQPQYAKYTITALSEQCGFKSRTPFLTSFKKFTGMTPSEFMDKYK